MEEFAQEPSDAPAEPAARTKQGWQILWFVVHLAGVYAIVKFFTPWLSGWTYGTLMPLLQIHTSSSRFEFLFSHLFALSFLPAFAAGIVGARFRQKVEYIWLVPAFVLAYKLATFPSPAGSVLFKSHTFPALHHYFGTDFVIPEFHNWSEFWSLTAGPDLLRGMDQLSFTAPLYAGLGYSLAVWLCIRTSFDEKIVAGLKSWENARRVDREKPSHTEQS